MSRSPGYYLLLIILMTVGGENLVQAQSTYDTAYAGLAQRYPENLVAFTDRSLYAVNEDVWFSATLQSGEKPYQGLGSKVLYAELVNTDGESVAGGKYPVTGNHSTGSLNIPAHLVTGKYFVRIYTRWMRNFGPVDFTYIPIRVVNPYAADVKGIQTETDGSELVAVPTGTRIVSSFLSKRFYQPGETVEALLTLEDGDFAHIQHGCITVVPSGSIDTTAFLHRVIPGQEASAPFQFSFLPELKGITISGEVTEKGLPNPVPGIRVHFSIVGEDPAYMVTRSDEGGRFLLNTPPRSGNQEMFVVPEAPDDPAIEVHIDNDFASDPLPFRPGTFDLTQEEYLLASRFSLQMQLQGAFFSASTQESMISETRSEKIHFYGNPGISIRLDEYINLPNLEEIVENLIPRVYVVRPGGNVRFVIYSENPLINSLTPLILIDHIPVFDMEQIMGIPPSKIDLIEVIPEVYVVGEEKFGGIISITSRQGDFAGITIPEGSYFFDYTFFQPSMAARLPRYPGPGRIPDTRNTLFWKDRIELHKGEHLKISFQSAPVPGSYTLLFRGLSSEGEVVYGLDRFIVAQ